MSYILYLVDEDWGSGEKPDGGGLQLYPLQKDGVPGTPAFAPSKTIPPRWNQMVLFAVQPGRSFHDVQEVGGENNKHDAIIWGKELGEWDGRLDGADLSASCPTGSVKRRPASVRSSVSHETGAWPSSSLTLLHYCCCEPFPFFSFLDL